MKNNVAIKNRNAQAMVEFILMMPFLITIMIFIYQSYAMVHKVQIAQRYLKQGLVTFLGNRSDGHLDPVKGLSGANIKNFFVLYDEGNKRMKFYIDPVTKSLLLSFASSKQNTRVERVLDSFYGAQELGVCLDTNIKPELSLNVFDDWVCGGS